MKAIHDLSGLLTYGRLRSRGYTDGAIKQAMAVGFLKESHAGTLSVDRTRAHLVERAPDDRGLDREWGRALTEASIPMGARVARVEDGDVEDLDVVRDDGAHVSVIDPDNENRVIRVPKEEVAYDEEDMEDAPEEEDEEGDSSWMGRNNRPFGLGEEAGRAAIMKQLRKMHRQAQSLEGRSLEKLMAYMKRLMGEYGIDEDDYLSDAPE